MTEIAPIIEEREKTYKVRCPYCKETHIHGKQMTEKLSHCKENPQMYMPMYQEEINILEEHIKNIKKR